MNYQQRNRAVSECMSLRDGVADISCRGLLAKTCRLLKYLLHDAFGLNYMEKKWSRFRKYKPAGAHGMH